MCGITGIFAFNLAGKVHMINLSRATDLLSHRGPDDRGTFSEEFVGLGHRRLSIIDLSREAAQPMKDTSGRYTIVYNGEIYNFKKLRESLLAKGYTFRSHSDTEVLLYMYIDRGAQCLDELNGFFAFAVYDARDQTLFMARDRFGIKPLLYYLDEDKLIFGSEMPSILAYGLDKEIDTTSLYTYLQFNYLPAPSTMIKGVQSLPPGHFLQVSGKEIDVQPYYQLPLPGSGEQRGQGDYQQQQAKLRLLLDEAVQRRLVSDVPLGTFLSGGIDSSIITGIARKHKPDLQTFSIGFKDEPYFDETHYARLVADRFQTDHTVFSLTNDDLHDHLFDILNQMDQPFADSSAIPVYILSKQTSQHITVALSGDGADELFSGYNKHAAFLKSLAPSTTNSIVKMLGPLWDILPKSRNAPFSNRIRQLQKYARGLQMPAAERYWLWAQLMTESRAIKMIHEDLRAGINHRRYALHKMRRLEVFSEQAGINEMLLADLQLVLPDDMLKKVDLMSMAHGLEVRVPYLDHHLVEFVNGLPESSKINPGIRKKILQDAYREMLPAELYRRPKSGFEVPLLKWFRTSLKSLIRDDLLEDQFILEQGIFNEVEIKKIKNKLFSYNPQDVHAHIWALIVFQWWWKKTFKDKV